MIGFDQLFPLYAMVGLGFVAGRWAGVDRRSVAALIMHIVVPVVFIGVIGQMRMAPELLLVPVVVYGLVSVIALSVLWCGKRYFRDARANIAALGAATGNNGYFGLPVAMSLFDAQVAAVYLLAVSGVSVFESSLGFYITARGNASAREALLKVLKLPILYAMVVGCVISACAWEIPAAGLNMLGYFKGAYTVLGMMLVGVSLSHVRHLRLDWPFTLSLLVAKMLVWPLLAYGFVWLDRSVLGWFSAELHPIFLLMAIMPMAANTAAIATILDVEPEKVAIVVLISTVLAVGYVPWMIGWFVV